MQNTTDRHIVGGQLRPVETRKTVQDQVYEQLRAALMSGAFEARANFTIAALAERFQTSHMPVREALRRLAAEGALRISPAGTAFVPDIKAKELADISTARVIVEGATAEIAAARMGAADIETLKRLMAEHERHGLAGETEAMVAANRAFHFYIYERAGNPVLISQIENLWLRSGPYVRLLSDRMSEFLQRDHVGGFMPHHVAMLKALDAGNPRAFRSAMEDDIRATERLLAEVLTAEEKAEATGAAS